MNSRLWRRVFNEILFNVAQSDSYPEDAGLYPAVGVHTDSSIEGFPNLPPHTQYLVKELTHAFYKCFLIFSY